MPKKYVVACGGTGGHAFPGLAVARELKSRGHEVVVWMSGRDVESSVLKSWDGPTFSTGARQLVPKNIFNILCSFFRCRNELRRFDPSAVLAMGSYSSLPPVLAAFSRRVPIILHEANTVPGKAVSFLSRFAKVVATTFDITKNWLKGANIVKTGLPVRSEIANQPRFEDIPDDAFVVFITGGSQGAHAVNEIMKEACVLVKKELRSEGKDDKFYVIHQTGVADKEKVEERYKLTGINARVRDFEREMGRAFASSNLVVCRAGASTCFELAIVGKCAFFIPLPSAMRDHQHMNAMEFVRENAADEGIQDMLSPEKVAKYILYRINHPEILEEKSKNMAAMAVPDAAKNVADLVEANGK